MRFENVWARYAWRPIAGCPGRFVMARQAGGPPAFEEVAGVAPRRFRVAAARDEVLVARMDDGSGVLSYAHADGTLVHTLNTPEGLARKLRQLGITLPG